jgi:hypothetical protein
MSHQWDTLSGLDLRRALAKARGWTNLHTVQPTAVGIGGLRGDAPDRSVHLMTPRWEADHGDALRLLAHTLTAVYGRVSDLCVSDGRGYVQITVPFDLRWDANGASLPEAIARCCGKALEAQKGGDG